MKLLDIQVYHQAVILPKACPMTGYKNWYRVGSRCVKYFSNPLNFTAAEVSSVSGTKQASQINKITYAHILQFILSTFSVVLILLLFLHSLAAEAKPLVDTWSQCITQKLMVMCSASWSSLTQATCASGSEALSFFR